LKYAFSKKLFLLLTLVALLSAFALAQVDLGSITGTVTDPTGAVISGAKVMVTSVSTGYVRSATTDASGLYAITNLKPDNYSVKVEAAGFSAFAGKVQVTVGSKNEISPKMQIAAAGGTTIEVSAGVAVAVETQTQELSQVVSEQQIRDMPTIARNPYDLVSMAGNVAHDPNEAPGSTRGVGFSLNGGREASTNVQLDGADNSDLYAGAVGQTIPLDSMQEFRVVSSGLGAEYGRTTSGVVNVSTKSGTNNFHGSAYEWNRVAALAANDYDSNARGLKKAGFTRNQFGYSFGGPIKKNKLFFFNNTEWTRVRSAINDSNLVPTPEFIALAGTCAGCSADGANTRDYFSTYGNLATPINGKIYTKGELLDPATGALKKSAAANPLFAALPDNTPIFGEVSQLIPYDSGGGTPQNTYNMLTRVDYNITDKTTVYGRYSLFHESDFDGTNSNSPFTGYNTGYVAKNQNALLDVTHVFSPSLVSESKFLFTRLNQTQPLTDLGTVPSLYFNGSAAAKVGSLAVALPGYLPYNPGSAIPFGGPQNYGQLIQDFSWTKGKHQVKFGGMFMYVKDNHFFGAYQEAVEAFSASGWGSGLDQFLNGHLASFQVAVDGQGKYPCAKDPANNYAYVKNADCTLNLPVSSPSFSRSNRYRDSSAYIQDSWKLTSRFTLNLGVRWEYYGVQHNNKGDLDSNFYLGSGKNYFEQIANGKVDVAPNSPEGGLWARKPANFAPRFGFAWDVFGNGKTSLRGGFGMGYERNFNNVTYNVIQNPPAQINIAFASPGDGTILVSPNNLGQFATGTGTKFVPNASLRAVKQDIATSKSYFWNIGIDREIAKNTTMSVAYTGSKGEDLYSIANINRNGAGNVYLGLPFQNVTMTDSKTGIDHVVELGSARLNQQYGNINYRGDSGESRYHAMNVNVRSSNLAQTGLSIVANYTWAHAIDNLSSTFTDGGANNNNLGFLDPFNPGLDMGNADFDIRHRVSLSFIWDVPFFKSTHGIANRVLDGWEIAPMLTARTGAPFSVFDCNNQLFAVCPRAIFNGALPSGKMGAEVDTNTFNYLDLSNASGGAYADPVSGYQQYWSNGAVFPVNSGEFPTCTGLAGQGCAWPTDMTRRNSFAGPGSYSLDMGILKNFKVTEGSKLQFRAELFNAFNHPVTLLNVDGNNDVSVGSFVTAYKGGVQGTGHRRIQLALKYTF
jgi:outer membrane receptor protein involved in Fe transport